MVTQSFREASRLSRRRAAIRPIVTIRLALNNPHRVLPIDQPGPETQRDARMIQSVAQTRARAEVPEDVGPAWMKGPKI